MWLGVLQWMEVEGGDTRRTSGEIFFEAQDWTSGVAWLRIHCASEVFFVLAIWLLWFFVSGLNDKLTYSSPASSTFMENEDAVSSRVPSLPRLAKQSWRSNQILETRPNGLSGERAVDSRSNFRSASVTCGWCFALSWPFFRCLFIIDLNTLLLMVNSLSARDGREDSITRVLLVTNELGWCTGKLEFAYTHTNKVF